MDELVGPLARMGQRRQHVVELGLDLVALVRSLAEQVERPGERTRGGLVAGADESDDVILDLRGRQAVRLDQQRQEILRRSIRVAFDLRPALADGLDDQPAEIGHGLAPPKPSQPGQEGRRAEEIERVDAAHRAEEVVRRAGEGLRIAGDVVGEKRRLQDVERQERHFQRPVDRLAGLSRQFLREQVRPQFHRLGEAGDVARREHRRDGFSRAPPQRAFRRQQPVAQERAQDPLAQRLHDVVLGVLDQTMANAGRIVDDDVRHAQPVAADVGLLERPRPPDLDRVA